MLLLDPRIGSGDLEPALRNLGVSVEVTHLDYADCSFVGFTDRPVTIGVELKKLADILQCIETGRWAGGQLPGLIATYDYIYLVIEGIWRAGTDGILETMLYGNWRPIAFNRRKWMYRDFVKFLLTQATCGGVTVWQTGTRDETARFIAGLYDWWQAGTDAHTSHLAFDRTVQVNLRAHAAKTGGVNLLGERMQVSLLRRIAAELPGVGVERSAAVAEHFPSIQTMVLADSKEWQRIPGIGKTIAQRIVKELE